MQPRIAPSKIPNSESHHRIVCVPQLESPQKVCLHPIEQGNNRTISAVSAGADFDSAWLTFSIRRNLRLIVSAVP